MKKVTSILAIVVMAVGMATVVIEDTSNTTEFLNDSMNTAECDDCSTPPDDRKPPKRIA
ncbi:hypothetical protein [Maribacter forsetii]|uniref:hypothetical protein n=1 Tax=Maribacter forsetii TaxID=444515 RepID=UPI000B007C33|nr:hypothetical protein [Maribacter forsetii]